MCDPSAKINHMSHIFHLECDTPVTETRPGFHIHESRSQFLILLKTKALILLTCSDKCHFLLFMFVDM